MGKLKLFLNLLLILFCVNIYSQIVPTKYYIQFTDKNNSPYTLSSPLVFLSQRALDRRTKQGYSLDERDLPVNPSYIDSILAAGNVTLLNITKWLNGVTILTSDSIALVNINAFSFVQNVKAVAPLLSKSKRNNKFENDLYTNSSLEILNKKPKLKSKDSYDYGYSANQIEMIGLDYLHNLGYHGEDIIIAQLDAGFNNVDTMVVFDSLRNDNRILGVKDFVDHSGNVYSEHIHGMMVLSLMAGNIPGQLIGTSPKASFWLLRPENGDTEYIIEEYNWVSAAEFADSVGADIINSSLGYSIFDDSLQNHTFADLNGSTTVVSRGANIAASKGILVVNSAGNSAQTPWQRILVPSDADSVLTVGAVDENGSYAPFSSVGNTFDGRIKPDIVSQGANTVVASTQGGIMTGNGTSFSAPIISGAVACLWQANPNATNMQLMEAIRKSASQYNNPDSLLGYGIPNFAIAHQLLAGASINENKKDYFFTVFPNPFEDWISLDYIENDSHLVTVELYDFCGRNIYSIKNFKNVIGYNTITINNLDEISKGIYFLKISEENKIFIRKLVKIS